MVQEIDGPRIDDGDGIPRKSRLSAGREVNAVLAELLNLGVVPLNWTIAGVGDFDGNGSTDILWRDTSTGTVAIWLMDGIAIKQAGSLGVVPGNWSNAMTGDFTL